MEIRHLATTTETIFFVDRKEIPQDRQCNITLDVSAAIIGNRKRTRIELISPWEEI